MQLFGGSEMARGLKRHGDIAADSRPSGMARRGDTATEQLNFCAIDTTCAGDLGESTEVYSRAAATRPIESI
ncbi:MAG: hypothetical protein D6753_09430 [Planctomycetota bacterium]|nr:MAG: hypothetical protein D6753_09430 [Planctomycetota bacterium]